MIITKNEKDFLDLVYLDMQGNDTQPFKYHHKKRLDDYFISHLTGKKIRLTYRLIDCLYFIIQSASATDIAHEGAYLNEKQFDDLANKIKKYLDVN
jgi:hypothetical protein